MKRKKAKGTNLKYRVYFVLALFFIFFSAVFLRAFQLQILEAPKLKKMAAKQHRKTVNVQSKRGDIYDRNLKELAVSIEVDSVYAQPGKVESPAKAARSLAPVLSMDAREIEKKLSSGQNFVWIKRQVDLKEEERGAVTSIEGVGITKESRRYYPNRQLASNIIGFTGLDAIGLEGIERYYDSMLKGAASKITGDKDATGRMLLFEDPNKKVPVEGMVVELTIDKTIQYIAEKVLKKAVEDSDARGGVALVMDPNTGEVLAMASQPTFDPNDIGRFDSRQWRNRSVTDVFEPGSTFKLFLVAAALEEDLIKTKDIIYCENGSYRVADRTFHDHEPHGWLTVPQIIKYSSNIGSAKIGEKLGKVQLYRYLKAFGFGSKTGIDLPGEASGALRHYSKWSGVTIDTVSFGQGISVTALQLTSALSSVANGGFLMKPYVVRSIKDPNGAVVRESHPEILRRVISEDTARKMTEMLIGVTEQGGTGVKAAMPDFEVAGKTGTAQKPDFKNGGYMKDAFVASFFGFVPARSPRLAIVVAVDEPRIRDYWGGSIAAPAFRDIAQQSLSYLGVFPENKAPEVRFVNSAEEKASVAKELKRTEIKAMEAGQDMGQGASNPDSPMSVPDFTGKTMRTVLRMARQRSLDVEVLGSGRAASQRPAPGGRAPEKGVVAVSFQ